MQKAADLKCSFHSSCAQSLNMSNKFEEKGISDKRLFCFNKRSHMCVIIRPSLRIEIETVYRIEGIS